MNNNPLVSVIISLYNSSNTIEDTLNSVLNQTYHNFEIIVVDDCSTDSSFSIVEAIKRRHSKIKLFKTLKNSGGPAHPRNVAINNSQGNYLAFLDSDDLWTPEKLEIQLYEILNYKYDFICSDLTILHNGKESKSLIRKYLKYIFFKLPMYGLMLTNQICLSSVLCKKELIIDKMFNEDIQFHGVEDYSLWIDIFANAEIKLKYLNVPLVKYRIHNSNISSNSFLQYFRTNYCISNYYILKGHYSHIFMMSVGIFYRTFRLVIHKIIK